MDNLILAGHSICGHSNFASCYGNTGVVSPPTDFVFLLGLDFVAFFCSVVIAFYLCLSTSHIGNRGNGDDHVVLRHG